jgi:hypothetical protein
VFDKGIIAPFMVKRNSQTQSTTTGSGSPVSPAMQKHLNGTRWIESEPTESVHSSMARLPTTSGVYFPVDAETSSSGISAQAGPSARRGSRDKEVPVINHDRDRTTSGGSVSDRRVSYVHTPITVHTPIIANMPTPTASIRSNSAASPASDTTVSELRRELVGVQAELGNLRSELQSLTGVAPPGYVR